MNIHPILVHFPIALLTIYALLEIFSLLKKVREYEWLEHIKAFLVIVGVLSAFFTLSSGEVAENMINKGDPILHKLVETHGFFASVSTDIFLGIAILYALRFIKTKTWYGKFPVLVQNTFNKVSMLLDRRWVLILGALVGLLSITITGALGGSIVYGPGIDPVADIVYKILIQ